MSWKDKPGTCEVCGKPIILKSSRHRWCRDCAKEMNRLQAIRSKDEQKRRAREFRAGRDPDWWKGTGTECKVKMFCVYGSRKFCEYMTVEGHSRLLAGHPIRDGKCDLYKKGKKRLARDCAMPETSPVLAAEKLREV